MTDPWGAGHLVSRIDGGFLEQGLASTDVAKYGSFHLASRLEH